MMKKQVKKALWQDMQITKISLNPEQAVLGCCDSSSKHERHGGSYHQHGCTAQCGTAHGGSCGSGEHCQVS